MREAEEVERLGLPLSKFLTLLGRVATEADQPGFRWVQCQFELPHSFLQVMQESLRFMLMLEADNGVIRVTDDDHGAGRLAAPAVGPKVVHVVQVDVFCERRSGLIRRR